MGGIARVKLHYTSLPDLIQSLKDIPVYGTFLDGENMYTQKLSSNGWIVMGNEGNMESGKEVEQLINRKLYIPNYPAERETSESLNDGNCYRSSLCRVPSTGSIVVKSKG